MAEQNASINGSVGGNNDSWWTPEELEELLEVLRSLETELTDYPRKLVFAGSLFIWMISVVEIPIMIVTLLALCVLLKSQRSAPIFVIHLILSDLIQIICMVTITFVQTTDLFKPYWYALTVGLYFMACVAVERYLLVSHPIWYKTHHSLKVCCVISVIIWFVPLIFKCVKNYVLPYLPRTFGCFFPYPIVILCFVGTCRGLSRSTSLTPLKRKLILGSLFLVLVTYTCIILPHLVLNFLVELFPEFWDNFTFVKVFFFSACLLYLNPLADCILYLLMRPDVGGLMESVHCCCRTDTHLELNTQPGRTHTRQ